MTRIEAELTRELKAALQRIDDMNYRMVMLDVRLQRLEELNPAPERDDE